MAKIKIVDKNFNCHNKISYIKNLPNFFLLTWDFQGSFDKLCPNLPDSFSFSLLCICIYEFYLIKHSHFTETKIYVKLDPKNANTAHSYHLKSDTIYSIWNYLS